MQASIVWVLCGAKVIVWVHFTVRSATKQVTPWILTVLEAVETGHLLLLCQPDWREDSTTVATVPIPQPLVGMVLRLVVFPSPLRTPRRVVAPLCAAWVGLS